MGQLSFFKLQELKNKYNTPIFIETGIGNGDGVIEAQKVDFERIISVEIMPQQCVKMREKFKDDKRVEIIEGATLEILPKLLLIIDKPICFWLDAHFKGADIGYGKHDDMIDEDIRLPLEKELNIIKNLRTGKDVVLFDDLLVYKDQGRHHYRQDVRPRRPFSSDRFYQEILSETHQCYTFDSDTGYAILTPKNI